MDAAEEKAADVVKRRREALAAKVAQEGDAGLKSLLAPFSVIPEEHSLATGAAPKEAQKAFEGWTTKFKNTDPITVIWFPHGVPHVIELMRRQEQGVLMIQAKGARSIIEARIYARQILEGGGCGFVSFLGIHCGYERCVSSQAFKRCVHDVAGHGWTEKDAERGRAFMRDMVEADSRRPDEKIDVSPDGQVHRIGPGG